MKLKKANKFIKHRTGGKSHASTGRYNVKQATHNLQNGKQTVGREFDKGF